MTGAQCYIVVAPAMQCFWNIRFCYLEPIFYLLDIAATVLSLYRHLWQSICIGAYREFQR